MGSSFYIEMKVSILFYNKYYKTVCKAMNHVNVTLFKTCQNKPNLRLNNI